MHPTKGNRISPIGGRRHIAESLMASHGFLVTSQTSEIIQFLPVGGKVRMEFEGFVAGPNHHAHLPLKRGKPFHTPGTLS